MDNSKTNSNKAATSAIILEIKNSFLLASGILKIPKYQVTLITGVSGSGKTTLLLKILAGIVKQRTKALAALRGDRPIEPFVSPTSIAELSPTPGLLELNDLPSYPENFQINDFICQALDIKEPLLSNNSCPTCKAALISLMSPGGLARSLLKSQPNKRCSIGILSDQYPTGSTPSHVIVDNHEYDFDLFEPSTTNEPYFLVSDRFSLVEKNLVRLEQALINFTGSLRILVGDSYFDTGDKTQMLCTNCLKLFSQKELSIDSLPNLNLKNWAAALLSIEQENLFIQSKIQELIEYIKYLDLENIVMAEGFNDLSPAKRLRLLYMQVLLNKHQDRLVVIDSPWLPCYLENRLAEQYLLQKLSQQNNTIVAASTDFIAQMPNHFHIENRQLKKVVIKPDEKVFLNIKPNNGLEIVNDYCSWIKLKTAAKEHENFAASYNCKRAVYINFHSKINATKQKVLDIPGVTQELSELYCKLPRAKELGLSSSHIKAFLKSNDNESQNGVSKLTFKSITLGNIKTYNISTLATTFTNIPKLAKPFNLLNELGLGNVSVGIGLAELSHGELRRYLIAKAFLSSPKNSLFLAEYPTLYLTKAQAEKAMQAIINYLEKSEDRMIIFLDY